MSAMAWKPATVFRSTSDVTLWNALMMWAGEKLPLPPSGEAVFVASDQPDPRLRAHHLRLEGGIDFIAAPLSFPFQALFGGDFDVDELERLPPALASRLDQTVIDVLWRLLPDTGLATPVIVATGPTQAMRTSTRLTDDTDLYWFTVDLAGLANGRGMARVLIGARLKDIVHVTAGGRIASRTLQQALAMRITAAVTRRIATLSLSAHALAALAPGDVIVLDAEAGRTVTLSGQGWLWQFQPHERGLAIVAAGPEPTGTRGTPPVHVSPLDATHPEGAPTMTETLPSDGLTFDIHFEIGRFDVPIGALDAWRPGTVVTFEPPQAAAGATVTLTVNGRDIGHGDLIGVDDRLAVRITHLIGADRA